MLLARAATVNNLCVDGFFSVVECVLNGVLCSTIRCLSNHKKGNEQESKSEREREQKEGESSRTLIYAHCVFVCVFVGNLSRWM